MSTCFAFKLFLLSEISCPALIKIHSGGTDVSGIERYVRIFAGLDIQSAGTRHWYLM